jgi:myo-inositol-1(or 4)-monophosphatase
VSEIDHAAEAAIVRDAAVGVSRITRSSPRKARTRAPIRDADYVWIIDPLDGTTNFLHGFPQYCVSIALAHANVVQQGVIYDPVRNDLFTATRGRGAFLNDRACACRAAPSARLPDRHRLSLPRRQLSRHVSADDEDDDHADRGLRRPARPRSISRTLRRASTTGSGKSGLNPWDVAAGSLLVLEAGGLIGDLAANENYLHGGQVIAANPKVFAQMVATLAPFRDDMAPREGRRSSKIASRCHSVQPLGFQFERLPAYARGIERPAPARFTLARTESGRRDLSGSLSDVDFELRRAALVGCRVCVSAVRRTPRRVSSLRVMLHPYAAGGRAARRAAGAARSAGRHDAHADRQHAHRRIELALRRAGRRSERQRMVRKLRVDRSVLWAEADRRRAWPSVGKPIRSAGPALMVRMKPDAAPIDAGFLQRVGKRLGRGG